MKLLNRLSSLHENWPGHIVGLLIYFPRSHSRKLSLGIHPMANNNVQVSFDIAGFRPGRRVPFLSGKGTKTIDAQSDQLRKARRKLKRTGQLAALKQGLPNNWSVRPRGQPAGVGNKSLITPWEKRLTTENESEKADDLCKRKGRREFYFQEYESGDLLYRCLLLPLEKAEKS